MLTTSQDTDRQEIDTVIARLIEQARRAISFARQRGERTAVSKARQALAIAGDVLAMLAPSHGAAVVLDVGREARGIALEAEDILSAEGWPAL